MKTTLRFSLCILIQCVFYLVANAQYVLIEADKQYALYNYDKAIDLYEQAYKKKASLHAAERLASSYRFQNNYRQAESWYAIASNMPQSKPENVLHYAKALQSTSKYAEAKIQFQKYATLKKDVPENLKRLWDLSCDSALQWMKNPTEVTINNEQKLNSQQSDWGTSIYKNDIVFVSDRNRQEEKTKVNKKGFLKFDGPKYPDKEIYGWTGNQYQKLNVNSLNGVDDFSFDGGTNYHVGPASFTDDGKSIYYALTKVDKNIDYHVVKAVKGKLATSNIEIYSSQLGADGAWTKPAAFKYNNLNDYSVGDPFITPDGKKLYFVSDMPGGKGGTDIYVSTLTNGEWSSPVNLAEVNTEGDERTPFIDSKDRFYFSSDGYVGMGSLDIFSGKIVEGKVSSIKNLGYPTNSPQDDFAFVQKNDEHRYFSSNRDGGLGNDDIYSLSELKSFNLTLTGIALDKNTNVPLENTIVSLTQKNGSNLKVQTGSNGRFDFKLTKNSDYELLGEKTNYRSDASEFTTKNITSSTKLERNLYLEKIQINKEIRLENIYYDFDKSNIRTDAAVELDKLVKILKENPTIWIELGSHTDSRGDDKYNQALSQRRADAAVKYIVDKGISKNRITAEGYGESKLLNKCANGVKCTIEEHQLNRRTEFKITKQ